MRLHGIRSPNRMLSLNMNLNVHDNINNMIPIADNKREALTEETRIILKNELELGELKIIPLKGLPIISDWRLVWLKSKPLTPAAKAFLDYIHEKKDAIFARSFSWIQTIHPPDFH
jgi:hypothetical protein